MKLFKNTQSGRSMVEMLGVLAIIGVLSVGGIAGYSKAMFKYKLNQTLDAISHAFSRLVEIDGLNMSRTEIVGATDMIKYGIMPDCQVTDFGCQLPLSNVNLMLGFWGTPVEGNMGVFQVRISGNDRTRVATCNAILSANLHEIYPDEWWTPSFTFNSDSQLNDISGVRLGTWGEPFYTKYQIPGKPEINTITPAKIAEACESCHILYPDIDVGYCAIYYTIRFNTGL